VANSAPFESETWYQFIQNLERQGKHSVARVLAALGLQLKNLDEFGSLLRIEDEMQKVIQKEKEQWIAQAKAGMEQPYLFPEMAKPRQQKLPFETAITDKTFFDRLGSVIQKELDSFYEKARQDGLAEEAIMAADAERGFDFFRLSINRYDVVYTNPPYMGSKNMGERLKKFVARAYPQGKRDLYAAFILRCIELSRKNGYVGMVAQQSWMFLRTFADLRALPDEKIKRARLKQFTGLLRDTTIETLAHLGPGAFLEISGEVVNTVLFTLSNNPPSQEHKMVAFRLVGSKEKSAKDISLQTACLEVGSHLRFESCQAGLLAIPFSPVTYWLSEAFVRLLIREPKVSHGRRITWGVSSSDNERFLRLHWELHKDKFGKRWLWHAKGGGFCKWAGLEQWVVDWRDNGSDMQAWILRRYPYLGKNFEIKVRPDTFFQTGWVYSSMTGGSPSFRWIENFWTTNAKSPLVFAPRDEIGLGALLNSRLSTFLLRSLSPSPNVDEGYVGKLPFHESVIEACTQLITFAIALKRVLISHDPREKSFRNTEEVGSTSLMGLVAILSELNASMERAVFEGFNLSRDDINTVIEATSPPVGWYPLITEYDMIPDLPSSLPPIPHECLGGLAAHTRIPALPEQLARIKEYLRTLYIAGPGVKVSEDKELLSLSENDYLRVSGIRSNDDHKDKDIAVAMGARIPIPTETFLEEISQKMEIHPISVYWLIEEMSREEGLVCPAELKRQTEDYVSVLILRILGYQWPERVEDSKPLPIWVDDDGIIPLTEGLGEPTLLGRVRERFGADFGEEKEASIESEFANIVGKPLERWLEEDFFARHVKQFKNRPIAWHIVSEPSVVNYEAASGKKGKKKGARKKLKPAFSVMVHYHRFVDGDKGYGKLLLLKNKYLENLMSQTRSELESLRGKGDDPKIFDRIAELDRRLVELEDFRERLERIQGGKDREARIHVRWKGPNEQPRGWRPDINDGVKINIAPWERLSMFPVKKIVGKVEMGTD
jgi:hypothetical protein